jgi:hypothetical protein
MKSHRLKSCCALVIAVSIWTLSSESARAAETEGWSCEKGSGYCCDCVWSETYRQCNSSAEQGNYYEKCGVADDYPCTGDCTIV